SRVDSRAAGDPAVAARVHPAIALRLGPGGTGVLLLAGRGRPTAGQLGGGAAALRHLLPRTVLPGGADGADVRRREHHGGEGAEDLRAAAGQPASARYDP